MRYRDRAGFFRWDLHAEENSVFRATGIIHPGWSDFFHIEFCALGNKRYQRIRIFTGWIGASLTIAVADDGRMYDRCSLVLFRHITETIVDCQWVVELCKDTSVKSRRQMQMKRDKARRNARFGQQQE